MSKGRRRLNISLIILSLLLTGWTVWICRQPSSSYPHIHLSESTPPNPDTAKTVGQDVMTTPLATDVPALSICDTAPTTAYKQKSQVSPKVKATRLRDADVRSMTGTHPFSAEARKVLSGNLEETDSLSRHRILSYCEHLRTSYTTRDIDFLRQVFSDNALIIVGHTVRTSDTSAPKGSRKVSYSIRSKHEYLANLTKIFDSGRDIDLSFSSFRIIRHPTMEGIYGVTLRQQYSCGSYADDGWLFLLWDFRNPSMPLIHVRTWQPASSLTGEDDIIDMSDFNLE